MANALMVVASILMLLALPRLVDMFTAYHEQSSQQACLVLRVTTYALFGLRHTLRISAEQAPRSTWQQRRSINGHNEYRPATRPAVVITNVCGIATSESQQAR